MQLRGHNVSFPGKANNGAHSDGLIDVDAEEDNLSAYPRLFRNSTLATTYSPALYTRPRSKSSLAESAGPYAIDVGCGGAILTRITELRLRIPCRHLCRASSKGQRAHITAQAHGHPHGHLPLTLSPYLTLRLVFSTANEHTKPRVTSSLSVPSTTDGMTKGERNQRCASRFLCLRSHFVPRGETTKGTRLEIPT